MKELKNKNIKAGLVSGFIAYFWWGFLPLFFIYVDQVPSMEIFAHRVFWAVPFGAIILLLRKEFTEVKKAFLNTKILFYLILSALMISVNWYIFIVAVHQNQILQASLGYYINPLFHVLVGVVFLKEGLRKNQFIAIVIATIGVFILTINYGKIPLISISLAASFTVYAVIRKKVDIGAMAGLFIETLIIFPFVAIYIFWLMKNDLAVFGFNYQPLTLALILAGPFTIIPLVTFAFAARRLRLVTIGMMQFLSPTIHFLIALYFGEPLTKAYISCFICIWIAVGIFVYDAISNSRISTNDEDFL